MPSLTINLERIRTDINNKLLQEVATRILVVSPYTYTKKSLSSKEIKANSTATSQITPIRVSIKP